MARPDVRRLGVAAALIGGELVAGDVEIRGGRISAVGLAPSGTGLAIPGLVDLQVNGYAGVDFAAASPAEYRRAERRMLLDGVMAYLPTIITSGEVELTAAVGRARAAIAGWVPGGARPMGIHLEGPFISPERPGVHPRDAIREPDLELAERLVTAPVTFVTLAPERPDALPLIHLLRRRGVTVACGHSDATYEEAVAGFAAGATAVTHLFNAMRPLAHREAGIVGAALLSPGVHIGLVADGVHVAPEVIEIVRRLAGDRTYLVTDAVAAAGAPDGVYRIGDVTIERRGDRVLGLEGQIGGGLTPLLAGVRRLVERRAPLAWAVGAASRVPAALVGEREAGRLAPGAPADLLVVTDDLKPVRVLVGGTDIVEDG